MQNPNFDVRDEELFNKTARVVKTTQPAERQVQDFKMNDLKTASAGRSFGNVPRAPRGGDAQAAATKKDQRFLMSQLARDALLAGNEQERVIEDKVQEKLNALSEKTWAVAQKQGYDDGFKKGQEEAFAAIQAESSERLKKMDELLSAFDGAKEGIFQANQEFLMNLVYRVSKAVLLRELAADKEYLLRLSRELIERSGLRENLTLKINPADADSIDALKAGLSQSFSTLKNLSIELSDHVHLGGCVLETEWGAIDASLETQLTQVLSTLDVAKGTTA